MIWRLVVSVLVFVAVDALNMLPVPTVMHCVLTAGALGAACAVWVATGRNP